MKTKHAEAEKRKDSGQAGLNGNDDPDDGDGALLSGTTGAIGTGAATARGMKPYGLLQPATFKDPFTAPAKKTHTQEEPSHRPLLRDPDFVMPPYLTKIIKRKAKEAAAAAANTANGANNAASTQVQTNSSAPTDESNERRTNMTVAALPPATTRGDGCRDFMNQQLKSATATDTPISSCRRASRSCESEVTSLYSSPLWETPTILSTPSIPATSSGATTNTRIGSGIDRISTDIILTQGSRHRKGKKRALSQEDNLDAKPTDKKKNEADGNRA